MIDLSLFPVFLAGAVILSLTPGPDVAFTMASAIRGGTRSGVAAALGIGAGCLVWAGLSAAGLAAVLAASEHALLFVRLAGGFYLLALAAKTIEA
ncbi:MAG: LysE family transporter, partial [Amphiplicatus sp.]